MTETTTPTDETVTPAPVTPGQYDNPDPAIPAAPPPQPAAAVPTEPSGEVPPVSPPAEEAPR